MVFVFAMRELKKLGDLALAARLWPAAQLQLARAA